MEINLRPEIFNSVERRDLANISRICTSVLSGNIMPQCPFELQRMRAARSLGCSRFRHDMLRISEMVGDKQSGEQDVGLMSVAAMEQYIDIPS